MINCQAIRSSERLSQQRLSQYQGILGDRLVKNILCFGLFLLGVDREFISKALDIPAGTVRSLIRAIGKSGISAIEDRRRKHSLFLPIPDDKPPMASISVEGEDLVISLGSYAQIIRVSMRNSLQVKVLLLTMLNNDLISINDIARVLNLSTTHTHNLSRKLQEENVSGLIDKRGQKTDYKFTPEVKAEIIQQYIVDIVTEGRASGQGVAEHIAQRCQMNLSPRTVRSHFEKLGLSNIKKSLPELLKGIKKNP
ncbi:MAG: hypothetical protein GY782_02615 [Gammaproteobacteria bacterium]|nr:hypothetical protein [Gammaproteobacteria bacterium]